MSEPQILSWRLSQGDNLRAGLDTVEPLIMVGLSDTDNQARRRPLLAEQVPTGDNGLWRLHPDGRMEMTWRIRENARWHDGTPVTSEDLAFTVKIVQDRDLAQFSDARYRFIEGAATPDARTIVVSWRETFVEADAMFSSELGLPLPSHILGAPYAEDKASLLGHPYWSDAFVGTGPFKVQSFVRGSYVLLEANAEYVLGRPKIDAIEIRLILDDKTLVANVLAGAVELTLGRSVSVEQALDVRERWHDGRIEVAPVNFLRLIPQFLDPVPAITGIVQFRRALMHGIDRQEMVDTLMYGLSAVAHSWMDPGQAAYKDIEDRLVARYEYDPRKAAQILADLSISRDASGSYQLPAAEGGGSLPVEVMVSASQDINVKSMYAVADYWQRLGFNVNRVVQPTQMGGSERRVFEATRKGFFLTRQGADVANLSRFYSSQAPLPENNYIGNNAARFMSKDFDALLDRYYVTIPLAERISVVGQIVHAISDELMVMPLFYGAEPVVISSRLINVGARSSSATQAWNAHEWDMK